MPYLTNILYFLMKPLSMVLKKKVCWEPLAGFTEFITESLSDLTYV